MTDDRLLPPGQLSPSRELVPYPLGSRDILLRHNDRVVVYDPDQEPGNQLTPSRVSQEDLTQCPLCHRAFEHEDPRAAKRAAAHADDDADDEAPDIQANYFRLLADSRHATPGHGTPQNARGRLPFLPSPLQSASGVQTREPSPEPKAEGQDDHISSGAFTPGYLKRFFRIERELGRGGRGVVLLVKHVLDGVSLGKFACKRIPVGDDRKWLEHVLLEVSMLQEISHKNLVSYRHAWLEDYKSSSFGPTVPHVYILQQYCNAGTLFDHVLGPDRKLDPKESFKDRIRRRSKGQMDRPDGPSTQRQRLPFEDIILFFKDITSGVAHLHAQGLIHRDLKPQNCLLHRTGSSVKALVSDFGEMQYSTARRGPTATGYTGTISFAAPEVLMRGPDGSYGDFTTKSDVFSLGMIVYFMCFARLPYANSDGAMREENEDVELLRAEISSWVGLGTDRSERSDLPEMIFLYLRRLLSRLPSERPSTEDILQTIKANAGSGDDNSTSASGRSSRPTSPPATQENPAARPTSPPEAGTHGTSTEQQMDSNLYQRRSRSQSLSPLQPLWGHGTERGRPAEPPHSAALVRSAREESIVKVSPPRQLLLPAPPQPWHLRIWHSIVSAVHRHELTVVLRLAAFLAKMISLFGPCAPLAPATNLFYTLSLIAALDLTQTIPVLGSAGLLVIHLAAIITAQRSGSLCAAARPELWTVGER